MNNIQIVTKRQGSDFLTPGKKSITIATGLWQGCILSQTQDK